MTEKLVKGFKKFHTEAYDSAGALMPGLVRDGQKPDYFIISCIDSRANPGVIFQPQPGTFMAHKAMGAIVRPYKKGTALAAALQFAICHQRVKQLIVLGHTQCGAIEALVDHIEDEDIASFVQVAQKGLDTAQSKVGTSGSRETLLRKTEQEIVLHSAENLKTYPSVAKALEEGTLTIKPWIFEMRDGNLLEFSEKEHSFIPVTDYKESAGKKASCC